MAQCDKGSWLGKLALVEVALVCSATAPESGYLSLGGTRGLSINGEWGTTDVTSRSSATLAREYIATYIDYSGSIDGTTLRDSTQNQKTIRRYVLDPATSPDAWLRITIPDDSGATEVMEFPVLLNNSGLDMPYDDQATFSMDWTGNGAPEFTDVPA